MAFPNYPATSFEQAVDLAIFSSNQLGQVINGDATQEVDTVNGKIPTVRKSLIDNFFFKSPIAWENGSQETVFNQLRYFENDILSGYYYAPRATSTNPVSMGLTPVNDENWVLYSLQKEVTPSEVHAWLYETGSAEDLVITPPYVFDSAIVTINGVVQIPGLSYDIDDSKIILKEPLGTDPVTGEPNLLFAYLGKVEAATVDYVQNTVLASNIGSSLIGEVGSCASLRTLLPIKTNQKVDVKGYYTNSTLGGGKFYYVTDSVTTDDGGTFFRVNTTGGWKRSANELAGLNVTHFGAKMDGTTDDMQAILRMHNWSQAIDDTYGPGVKIPAGKIGLSSLDLGDNEIRSFKLTGPAAELGSIPSLTIISLNTSSTTPMFRFKARRMEIANIHYDGKSGVQPFVVNTVTRGAWIRIKSIVATDAGGRIFQAKDTLDTKIDQVYSYRCKAAFFWGTWSNESPGAWDHLTAIELSNFNFNGHTNEYAFSAIRATQSIMRNGWFDHCQYPFDISQGGWTLDGVIQENATNPAAIKYAKLVRINCRFEQGATLDDTLSGYTSDMDDDGKIPTWVTNAYDNGGVIVDVAGSSFDGGLSKEFEFSDTIFQNSTGRDTWFHAARITQQGRGRTCKIKFLGSAGWDSTGANLSRPTATNFGGGEATVFWELKYPDVATSSAGQVHWYGEGNCPIKEVRYVHTWQTVHIYVKIADYALSTAMFIEGNGDPRRKTGTPFFVVPYNEIISDADMASLANSVTAVSRWAINKGSYNGAGLGMDLDNGKLLLNAAYADQAGSRYLNTSLYGTDYYIPIQTTNQSVRIQRYSYSELPSPSTNVYGMVLCTNTTLSPAMQPLYSNGTNWYLVSDPSNNAWKPTT